jgi:hypothetical protein
MKDVPDPGVFCWRILGNLTFVLGLEAVVLEGHLAIQFFVGVLHHY